VELAFVLDDGHVLLGPCGLTVGMLPSTLVVIELDVRHGASWRG
jgi:hypothetical protein